MLITSAIIALITAILVGVLISTWLGRKRAQSEYRALTMRLLCTESSDSIIDASPPVLPISSDSPKRKAANYFARHWRGELPLPVSYWVNGPLSCVLVAILGRFVLALGAVVTLKTTVAAGILLYMLSFAVSVWQIVGTWRSASRHVGRGGRGGWATFAKGVLVLGALNLARFTACSTVPQIVEFSNILAGDNNLPSYEIRVLPGGTEVEFHGGIRAGSARELERILAAALQVKVLHVNSPGGRLREAAYMAELVRKRGLVTYTSEICLSAGTLVFIAGKERVVSARAKIGFHQAWLPGMTEWQRRSSDESLRQTMRHAGVSDDFITHVLATPHDRMWFPTIQEMRTAGVITSESFGERFAVSGEILRSSSPQDIDNAWGNLPFFRAIKDLEPETYRRMIEEFSTAVRSGRSESEAIRIAQGTANQLVLKYLPKASNEAMRAMRDLWVAMLERFKDEDSQACIAVFSPKSIASDHDYSRGNRLITGWYGTTNLAVIEKVLRSTAEGIAPQLDAVTADKDLAQIRSNLSLIYGDELDLMAQVDRWMEHSSRVCEILLSYYRETQRIPEQRQGNLLRYMLSEMNSTSGELEKTVTLREMSAAPTPHYAGNLAAEPQVRDDQLLRRLQQKDRFQNAVSTIGTPRYAGTDAVLLSDPELQRFVPPGFKGDRFDLALQYPDWASAMNKFVTQRASQRAR
jgi:hypothetical protein